MKAEFYQRTPYSYVVTPVPECFLRLDAYFDLRLSWLDEGTISTHPSVVLAENLCRRLADAVYYATLIADSLRGHLGPSDLFGKAIITGTLLVGHLSACKSVLDASSIAVARLYGLDLTDKQMDFDNGKFWKLLGQNRPDVRDRYERFRSMMQEVVLCRDASVHRTMPMVLVAGPDDPLIKPETASVKLVLKPDAGVRYFTTKGQEAASDEILVQPHYLHVKWYDELVKLCEEVCADIQART